MPDNTDKPEQITHTISVERDHVVVQFVGMETKKVLFTAHFNSLQGRTIASQLLASSLISESPEMLAQMAQAAARAQGPTGMLPVGGVKA